MVCTSFCLMDVFEYVYICMCVGNASSKVIEIIAKELTDKPMSMRHTSPKVHDVEELPKSVDRCSPFFNYEKREHVEVVVTKDLALTHTRYCNVLY